MSLVLNDEQQMLYDSASEFLKQNASIKSFRELRNTDQAFDSRAWQQMCELGWSAMMVPESFDGLEFGLSGLGLIAIEIGKNLSVSPLISSAALSVTTLLQCESSEQRDSMLGSIASGKSKVAFACYDGERFGSEQVELTASSNESGFVLNGKKTYVAEGSYADQYLVIANTSNDKTNKQLGLFVIDSTTQGISTQKLGLIDHRDYVNTEFDQVLINTDSKLNFLGDTESSLERILETGTLLAACELYGCSLEAFHRTLNYLGERVQFDKKIGMFQALQHRMAYAYTQLELLKSVLYDALHAVETQRKDAALSVSHAKTLANDTARLVTQESIQMHGGIGITDELDIGLFYKRARVLQTLFGDSSYHKNRFASLSGY